jgi:hypothetical protein
MHVIGDMGRFVADVLSSIESARRRVEVECFIVREDMSGRSLAKALSAAAQPGVCCGLIYDPLGSRWTPAGFFRALARGGVPVGGPTTRRACGPCRTLEAMKIACPPEAVKLQVRATRGPDGEGLRRQPVRSGDRWRCCGVAGRYRPEWR